MNTAANGEAPRSYGADDVIGRKAIKPFVARTNRHGVVVFAVHTALLVFFGWLLSHTWGTWWAVPAMVPYALLMAFLFNPVHECSHGTAFRSRALNETVYWIVCLVYMVPPTFFRYSHATHHTYTQIRDLDPDMLPERMTVARFVRFVAGETFWKRNLRWFLTHPFGRIAPAERYFLPDGEEARVVREARIIMGVYGAIAVVSVYTGSWMAITLWLLPRLIGEPSMRLVRVAEHAECEETGDLRRNTRTTRTLAPLRFLLWNMPYHAEHHLCPMVPFHALGRLHGQVGTRLFPVADGYTGVTAEVLSNYRRRDGVTWGGASAALAERETRGVAA